MCACYPVLLSLRSQLWLRVIERRCDWRWSEHCVMFHLSTPHTLSLSGRWRGLSSAQPLDLSRARYHISTPAMWTLGHDRRLGICPQPAWKAVLVLICTRQHLHTCQGKQILRDICCTFLFKCFTFHLARKSCITWRILPLQIMIVTLCTWTALLIQIMSFCTSSAWLVIHVLNAGLHVSGESI